MSCVSKFKKGMCHVKSNNSRVRTHNSYDRHFYPQKGAYHLLFGFPVNERRLSRKIKFKYLCVKWSVEH